jgi:hypothetical protein
MAKADKALVARRIDDVLRIRLDGAQFWDVREYVREREKEPGSAWFLPEGEGPLSDSQIRRYQQQADKLVYESHERSRKKLFRRHLAQRRHLYGRAVTTGDIRTALACAQDEARLLGLYPPAKVAPTTPDGKDPWAPALKDLSEQELAVLAKVYERAGQGAAGDGADREDRP